MGTLRDRRRLRGIRQESAGSVGRTEPAGRSVPHSTYWLVEDSGRVVAVSNLRHRLNAFLSELGGHIGFGVRPSARRQGFATEVLRLTLTEAREMGIESVFLTCDKGNVGSEKAILRNGGVLQDEIWSDVYSCVVQRFWISIASGS